MTTSMLRVICHADAGTWLDIAWAYSKFDQSSISCSTDMDSVHQNLNGITRSDHAAFRDGLSAAG